MPKKITKILLYTVVIAIVALFAVNEVMAFSDEPCYGLNYEYCDEPAMSAENAGWTIVLSEPTLKQYGEDYHYEWLFTLQSPGGGFTGANFVAFLIPDCCDDKIVFYPGLSFPENLFEYPVSDGEPTIYFGRYNNQAFVVKGTPDASGEWRIVTDSKYKTRSTIIIKAGKTVLEFEMAVPGCKPAPPPPPPPALGARTFFECANFGQDTTEDFLVEVDGEPVLMPAESDDVSFKIERSSDQEGCIKTLLKYVGLECTGDPVPVPGDVELPEEYVLQASFLRTCPDESISVTHSSPYYLYKFYSGGTLYKMCLDLGSGQWVNVSNCGL